MAVVLCAGSRCREPEIQEFPSAGEPELVSVRLEGDEVAAADPSVLRVDGTWHLFFTGAEGQLVGIFHATSDDGLVFRVRDNHRLIEEPDPFEMSVVRARVWYSGSRFHMLGDATGPDWNGQLHAESSDGDTWEYDTGELWFSDALAAPLSTGSALYRPISPVAWFSGTPDGDPGSSGCWRAVSSDGGDSWSDPELLFDPDDLPSGWSADAVGPGGILDCAVTEAIDEGYHMLYAGIPVIEEDPVGLAHARSDDGISWELENETWYDVAETDTLMSGPSLLAEEEGYRLYWSERPVGEDSPTDSRIYTMWLQ